MPRGYTRKYRILTEDEVIGDLYIIYTLYSSGGVLHTVEVNTVNEKHPDRDNTRFYNFLGTHAAREWIARDKQQRRETMREFGLIN